MYAALLFSLFAVMASAEPLQPGSHTRTVHVDGRERSYLVHVPPKYDSKRPTPVVLGCTAPGPTGRLPHFTAA